VAERSKTQLGEQGRQLTEIEKLSIRLGASEAVRVQGLAQLFAQGTNIEPVLYASHLFLIIGAFSMSKSKNNLYNRRAVDLTLIVSVARFSCARSTQKPADTCSLFRLTFRVRKHAQ
jgi:hypothetical protein